MSNGMNTIFLKFKKTNKTNDKKFNHSNLKLKYEVKFCSYVLACKNVLHIQTAKQSKNKVL